MVSGGRPVSSLPNLGPRSEEMFARAGIRSAEELAALGADAGYLRLLAAGVRPHFMGYCAVVLGLQGRPWSSFDPAEKPELRRRFDALKARPAGPGARPGAGLEAALDRIGVRLREERDQAPAGKPRHQTGRPKLGRKSSN